MRMDIVENKVDPAVGTPDDKTKASIYMPAPKGLLIENHLINWRGNDLGISGELVMNSSDRVREAFNSSGTTGLVSGIMSSMETAVGEAKKAASTWVDKQVMEASSFGIPIINQAFGQTARSNHTLMFEGVDKVRDFILEWSIFPNNYSDAWSIETIIAVLQKAALPKIENKTILDKVQTLATNTFSEKDSNRDVKENKPVMPSGLYSVTYKLPYKVKIKLFERKDTSGSYGNLATSDLTEITHLTSFPKELVMRNIYLEHDISGIHPPMVQFVDDSSGDTEYFHTKYNLRVSLTDITVTTSEDINYS